MSIERNIERIADALELLAGLKKQDAPAIDVKGKIEDISEAEPVKKNRTTKAVVKEDVAAPGPDVNQPINVPEPAPTSGECVPEKVYDLNEVLVAIRKYADATSADKAKAIMIKYGAAKDAPKTKDIPAKNYPALMKEIGY